MAKYIDVPSIGMFTYALDESEDYLVLNAYLHITESKKFDRAKYLRTFEYYHLQEGGTLNDNIFMQINGSLRLLGRPSLTFVNGHTTNFAALRGQEKVVRRLTILETLRSSDPAQRRDLIARKEAEAARLPERNPDLPNRTPPAAGSLSRSEVERRRAALSTSQQTDAGRGPQPQTLQASTPAPSVIAQISEPDRDFVPESTVQDNVVELIAEMHDLKSEVASLKTMLQTIFKNV